MTTPTCGEARAPNGLGDEWRQRIDQWLREWGAGELEGQLSVEYNRRLRRSLGRCRPGTGRVELAHWLRGAPDTILAEVLCHEVAHAAVHLLYGDCRPHGRLMPSDVLPNELRHHTHPRLPWDHRCPRCDASRRGRRATTGWRCSRCITAGFDGELEITRDSPTSTAHPAPHNASADVLTDASPEA